MNPSPLHDLWPEASDEEDGQWWRSSLYPPFCKQSLIADANFTSAHTVSYWACVCVCVCVCVASYQSQLKWHVNVANGGFGRAIYVGVFVWFHIRSKGASERERKRAREGHRCPCSVWWRELTVNWAGGGERRGWIERKRGSCILECPVDVLNVIGLPEQKHPYFWMLHPRHPAERVDIPSMDM